MRSLTTRPFLMACAGALLIAGLAGCGDDSGPPHKVYMDGGGNPWPDYGTPKYDFGFKFDKGIKYDGKTQKKDGSTPDPDGAPPTYDGGSGTCTGPTGASCTGCPTGHICSGAKGGTCAKEIVLSGPASNKPVLKAVAVAYVECWNKSPSSDTLCATFNTCKMTGTLTDKMVKDWVCNVAQSSDFPSSAVFDTAKSVVACSFYQTYRPDWKISSLTTGKKGIVCLTYDVNGWLYYDYLHVNNCSAYPPK